jgi:hypothetical protein
MYDSCHLFICLGLFVVSSKENLDVESVEFYHHSRTHLRGVLVKYSRNYIVTN